jgi:phosphoribosylglycinamide formyltransferase-1
MTGPMKTCVLVSGTGSNLQALIDACRSGKLNIEINHVISNVATARGLDRAKDAGIPTSILEHGAFAKRDDFDHCTGGPKRTAGRSKPEIARMVPAFIS